MTRDLDQLTQRLSAYLPDGGRITHVSRLSGGHSNETYLVHGIDKVLRMPTTAVPLLPGALDIRAQHDLFRELRGKSFAPSVPHMDFFCDDEDVLGAPFFLMERIDGGGASHWDIGELLEPLDLSSRDRLCRDYAEMIAGLSRVGRLEVLGGDLTAGEELKRWRDLIAHLDLPRLDALMMKLEDSLPDDLPATLVHGDCVFANMLWKDGRLVAVLDWELGFNGDPRWDLGYAIGQFDGPAGKGTPGFDLPGMWSREEMIALWVDLSGHSADGLEWFDCAGRAKGAAILYYGQHLWDSGESKDERLSVWSAGAERVLGKGEALVRYLA